MNNENKHYRYCFECDKLLKKEEVNEIDWGEQPGGGSGKTWNCSHCRKQVGDDSQIQIFRCHKHHDEILKVWGVLDGENKEKIFSEQCPQKQQQEFSFWEKIPLSAKVGGGIITLLLGLLITFKLWLGKTSKQVEKVKDQLKSIKVDKERNEEIKEEETKKPQKK